jgi:AraC-like DNA-binding protein
LNYHFREANLQEELRRVVFAARNDQMLEFYLGTPSKVRSGGLQEIAVAPHAVLVGIQAVGRVELFLGGVIRTFTITFRPLGFHRLFRISMEELAGRGLEASSVIGPQAVLFHDRLLNSCSFEEMVEHADEFLTPFALAAEGRSDYFFDSMTGDLDRLPLDQLVSLSGLGQRQFERRFKNSVGVSPKRFTRVARLQRALDLKSMRSSWTWGQVAAECGYHDQMHLVHDFKDLGGETPSAMNELRTSRDRGGQPFVH